ncbi:hypothetical protein [Boudabousia marimammalium]|uniref:Uncharacterized protein n=1 Tax=Boudabousia marimammalium TaxID=156892 RepID=A0A1Q5PS54_9ACTO|nr:hypothetical protein [Boudabousia marimammalium]OKL50414.1 hypothetical protein BM477_00075 [Boudabousia marimammalium]
MRLKLITTTAVALSLLLGSCTGTPSTPGAAEHTATTTSPETTSATPSAPTVSEDAHPSAERAEREGAEGVAPRKTPVRTVAEATQYLVGTYQFDLALEERAAFIKWAEEQDRISRLEQAKSEGKSEAETPEELAQSDRMGFSEEELKILADRDRQCKDAQIILRADQTAEVKAVWPCRDLWRIDPDASDWNVIRVQNDGTIQVRLGKSRFRVTEHEAVTPEMKQFEKPNRRLFAGSRFLKIG